MYIAISGNIGSGKTTLVDILSKRLGFTPYYEKIDNPYLDDFYKDMNRWAFQLQIAFLGKKIEQLFSILEEGSNIIQDRTMYEEAYIFVENLKSMGLIATRDYNTYMHFFNVISSVIPQPDVVVYLKASTDTLLSQIFKRGREYELNIEREYLESLNLLYERWINEIYKGKVVVIDMDEYDFFLNPEILDKIEEEIKPFLTK